MKKIITISREFGSGGRTIAKEAAQRLGYAFYDKELIEKIAEESGLSREYIEAHGEHAPGRTYFGYAFVGRDAAGKEDRHFKRQPPEKRQYIRSGQSFH